MWSSWHRQNGNCQRYGQNSGQIRCRFQLFRSNGLQVHTVLTAMCNTKNRENKNKSVNDKIKVGQKITSTFTRALITFNLRARSLKWIESNDEICEMEVRCVRDIRHNRKLRAHVEIHASTKYMPIHISTRLSCALRFTHSIFIDEFSASTHKKKNALHSVPLNTTLYLHSCSTQLRTLVNEYIQTNTNLPNY